MFGQVQGAAAGCFVIAEAGVNHNGDVATAHRLVDAAADAAADAVKFQTFDPALIVVDSASAAPYQSERGASGQRQMLDALTLPPSVWSELAAHARERGLVFLSTAFDEPSLELLLEVGVSALKSPSGELDNLPYLRMLAAQGLPLLVSTGASTLEEVRAAVAATAAAPERVLLHCVTAYPAPVYACNLRALPTLTAAFGLPVGWSDHTAGSVSAVASVALGSVVLEKHLTLDRGMAGPDHAASEAPAEFAAYVEAVRAASAALGDGVKRPADVERINLPHVRRSWHVLRDLPAGHVLTSGDVRLLRPQGGLAPSEDVQGARLGRAVQAGRALVAGDLA